MPKRVRVKVREPERGYTTEYCKSQLWREIQSGRLRWQKLLDFVGVEFVTTNGNEEIKAAALRVAAEWAFEQQRRVEFWEGGKPGVTEVI